MQVSVRVVVKAGAYTFGTVLTVAVLFSGLLLLIVTPCWLLLAALPLDALDVPPVD
jgi:hypothetical protein